MLLAAAGRGSGADPTLPPTSLTAPCTAGGLASEAAAAPGRTAAEPDLPAPGVADRAVLLGGSAAGLAGWCWETGVEATWWAPPRPQPARAKARTIARWRGRTQ